MVLFSKTTKLFLKKFISFCFLYGKICFLCVTISTIITVLFLWVKIEVNSNKNMTNGLYKPFYYIKEQQELQEIQYQQTGVFIPTITSKKVTKSLSEMIKIIPEVNEDIVFFNSVPRSGGELIVLLLQWLKDLNGFKHVRLPGGSKRRLQRYDQEKLIQAMMNDVRDGAIPFTFDSHVFFINFTSFGHQLPTYINFIRDPIDKAIARFYYHQVTPTPAYPTAKNIFRKKIQFLSTPSWKTKLHYDIVREFERCVKRDETRCMYQDGSLYDLTIPYFCGHEKLCTMFNSRWALNKAKETVERYYSVVGVLEEVNATLAVLQHRLPYFFRNVLDVFNLQLSETKKRRALNHPFNVLDVEVKRKLETQLSMEYEFYYFIRNRLLAHYVEAAEQRHL